MSFLKQSKVLLLSILMLLGLSACQTSADLAMQAYQSGDYVTSVNHYARYANKRGDQMTTSKQQEFKMVVNQSTQRYEDLLAQTNNNDHTGRIAQLTALKAIRASLSSPTHRRLVPEVMMRLDVNTLTQDLAQNYYQLGNSITGKQREDYKRRADAYQSALKQINPYKDSQALFSSNDKSYKGFLAEDLYQAGLTSAKAKDYKAAANSLKKIAAVYAPHGHYKNTVALIKQYETLWRTAEYKALMQKTDATAVKATKKSDFRSLAASYQEAVMILSTFGDSRPAQQKATKYQQLGMIQVYLVEDDNRLIRPPQTSVAESALTTSATSPFIRLTKERKQADIIVTITVASAYERDGDAIDREAQTVQVRDGDKTITHPDGSTLTEPNYLTKHFTKITTSAENRYTTKVKVIFQGLYQDTKHYEFVTTSEKKVVSYEGNVPNGNAYNTKQIKTMKSKDELAKVAHKEAGDQMYRNLSTIATQLASL